MAHFESCHFPNQPRGDETVARMIWPRRKTKWIQTNKWKNVRQSKICTQLPEFEFWESCGFPGKNGKRFQYLSNRKIRPKRTIVACVSSESHFRRTTKKVDFSLHGQYNDRCKHIYLRCIALERFAVSDWSWLWSCPMFRSRECQTQCCHGAGVGRPAGPPPPSSIKNECGISPCKPFILLILQRQWHLSSKLGSKQQQSYKSGESCLYNVSYFSVIHFGVGIFGAIPTGWFQGSLILKPSKMLNCKIKLCYHFCIDTKSIIRGPN